MCIRDSDYTHEYLIRIPEWIINEMNWYDGTELNIKLDGEELIIHERD